MAFIFIFIKVLKLNNSPANAIDQVAVDTLTDSQDGIDITINSIEKKDGKTVINLLLNNHVYDLSKMDAKFGSSLAGVKSNDYKIIDSATGGHHVQSQLIFDGDLSGPLTIKLNDSLIFNFTI